MYTYTHKRMEDKTSFKITKDKILIKSTRILT